MNIHQHGMHHTSSSACPTLTNESLLVCGSDEWLYTDGFSGGSLSVPDRS